MWRVGSYTPVGDTMMAETTKPAADTPRDNSAVKLDPETAAIAAQQSGGAQSKNAADGLQNADHADQLEGHDKQEPAKPKD